MASSNNKLLLALQVLVGVKTYIRVYSNKLKAGGLRVKLYGCDRGLNVPLIRRKLTQAGFDVSEAFTSDSAAGIHSLTVYASAPETVDWKAITPIAKAKSEPKKVSKVKKSTPVPKAPKYEVTERQREILLALIEQDYALMQVRDSHMLVNDLEVAAHELARLKALFI